MIVFINPSEAATYEKWCGPDWRVDMFGPNVEVRIIAEIPEVDVYKPNKHTVALPIKYWRLLNQGVPVAKTPKKDT